MILIACNSSTFVLFSLFSIPASIVKNSDLAVPCATPKGNYRGHKWRDFHFIDLKTQIKCKKSLKLTILILFKKRVYSILYLPIFNLLRYAHVILQLCVPYVSQQLLQGRRRRVNSSWAMGAYG